MVLVQRMRSKIGWVGRENVEAKRVNEEDAVFCELDEGCEAVRKRWTRSRREVETVSEEIYRRGEEKVNHPLAPKSGLVGAGVRSTCPFTIFF